MEGRKNRQKGTILAVTALSMIPLLGIAALASEVGFAYFQRTQLQTAADMAALAAIKVMGQEKFPPNATRIKTIAAETASLNPLRNQGKVFIDNNINSSDIEFGLYNPETETFTPVSIPAMAQGTPVNAIRVTARMEAGANAPWTFMISKVFNLLSAGTVTNLIMQVSSIATFAITNIVTTLDISASMDDRSYRPHTVCSDPNVEPPHGYTFHATHGHNFPDKDPDSGCFTPPDPAYENVIMPQPFTDVYEAVRDNLLTNRLFDTFYRAGLITYETTAYVPDPSTPDVGLRAEGINNKTKLTDHINLVLDVLKDYGLSNRTSPTKEEIVFNYGANFDFPAGTNYTGWRDPSGNHSGFTNIGSAIQLAVSQIVAANSATNTRALDMIILLSDGAPNCYEWLDGKTYCKDCPESGVGKDACRSDRNTFVNNEARQWALDNATLAKNNDIKIYAIYFATDPAETCDLANPSPGLQVMMDIASTTGGEAFCAQDVDCERPDCLKTIFNNLSERKLFVLAQ